MRPRSSRSHSANRRPKSGKRSASRSRSRSRAGSPMKQTQTFNSTEPQFLYETGTLGSGMMRISLRDTLRSSQNDGLQHSQRSMSSETFVRTVRARFHDRPDVYRKFVHILSQVQHTDADKLDLVKRVITLFDGHPDLIEGFNTFLPSEYNIQIQEDAVLIKVFESFGNMTTSRTDTGRSYEGQSWDNSLGDEHDESLTDRTLTYVQTVKEMYADQPHKYRQFMSILREFHSKHVAAVETIHKVVSLFRKYPHLVVGFNAFLPTGFRVQMHEKGYDIQYPGENIGEATIIKYKK